MADFNKIFDNIKDQVGAEAQTDLKEFSDQGKQDAQAFLDQSRDRLEKWMQLLADKQIDEDEFGWLVESQKAAAQMAALRKANAESMQIEQFRDSVLQIIVKTAVPALSQRHDFFSSWNIRGRLVSCFPEDHPHPGKNQGGAEQGGDGKSLTA